MVMLVPNGHYYEVVCSGGAVANWNEYTLPVNAVKSSDYALTTGNVDGQRTASADYNAGNDMFMAIVGSGQVELYTTQRAATADTNNTYGWQTPISQANGSSGVMVARGGEIYYPSIGTLTHWWEYYLG